ncbi:hypothetical protein SUGI_0015570 [Cryptomeria japonica]|nr:hypothetical protein SUGI_0015570 [Cryptomeria japonica]
MLLMINPGKALQWKTHARKATRDPTRAAAILGTTTIEAAPVIRDGLGASASSAPNTTDIITIIIIMARFRAAPAISTPFILQINKLTTRRSAAIDA